MIGIFGGIVVIITYTLLVAGLVVSKRYAFRGGFYFFLFLIIKELYLLFGNSFIYNFVDSIDAPIDLTIGELMTLLSFIPNVLEIIAFSFLIIGFYQFKKSENL